MWVPLKQCPLCGSTRIRFEMFRPAPGGFKAQGFYCENGHGAERWEDPGPPACRLRRCSADVLGLDGEQQGEVARAGHFTSGVTTSCPVPPEREIAHELELARLADDGGPAH